MLLTRKIIGEFAAVFLIGTVVGALIMWDVTDTELSKFMTKTNDSDSVMVARINQKYINEYHLTPEELDRIQPLIKEMAQHMTHIRHQFGIDVITTYSDYHEKIAAQLTPEHRDVYLKAGAERKKQLSELLKIDQSTSADQGQK
jgi:ribosomal protein L16 Arg81 hydroxylase